MGIITIPSSIPPETVQYVSFQQVPGIACALLTFNILGNHFSENPTTEFGTGSTESDWNQMGMKRMIKKTLKNFRTWAKLKAPIFLKTPYCREFFKLEKVMLNAFLLLVSNLYESFFPDGVAARMKKKIKWIGVLVILLTGICGCATTMGKKVQQGDDTVVFYPPFPQRPRLQFLISISHEIDIGAQRSAFDEFLLGKETSQKSIGKPYDIGSSKGKIYIMDKTANKLVYIDLVEKRFDYLKDNRQGTLNNPAGIWISEDDVKYIADFGRKQVVVFDSENNFLNAFGGEDVLEKPVDVAVYQGRIFICDMEKNRIVVLDQKNGELLLTFGEAGKEEGKLWKPTHLWVDEQGKVFVNDAFNFRIQEFDTNGKFVKSFGQIGDTLGSFARPKGLALSREGHLYVADAAFENVQIFDEPTGKLLLFFGGAGVGFGQMYLPCAVHIDYENMEYFSNYVEPGFQLKYLVYVGNFFGDSKVNVYGFGEWIGPVVPGKTDHQDEPKQEK
ncbi:MAG: hypothetical protein C0403_17940 [Desulfobacterium sp.]|nr:hypothetical protein [Desulfobacterium sp.]